VVWRKRRRGEKLNAHAPCLYLLGDSHKRPGFGFTDAHEQTEVPEGQLMQPVRRSFTEASAHSRLVSHRSMRWLPRRGWYR
jgi:hypothetical protein